jgi:Flp pilus assembly protein TadG
MNAIRRFLRGESGGGLVEFAISASVFTMLLLGMIEFGLASWNRNSVVADAREGARYATTRSTSSGRTATSDSVARYVKSKTSLDTMIRVTATWSPTNTPGSIVTVSVAHDVPRRGPFIPAHTDSSTSKMVVLF